MGVQLPVSQLVFSPDFWAMSRKTTVFEGVPGCNPAPFFVVLVSWGVFFLFFFSVVFWWFTKAKHNKKYTALIEVMTD